MLNLDVIAGFDNRTYPEGEDFPRSRDYFTIIISILGHSRVIDPPGGEGSRFSFLLISDGTLNTQYDFIDA